MRIVIFQLCNQYVKPTISRHLYLQYSASSAPCNAYKDAMHGMQQHAFEEYYRDRLAREPKEEERARETDENVKLEIPCHLLHFSSLAQLPFHRFRHSVLNKALLRRTRTS